MEVGGSQINAIELAGALRDRGHEVWVYSEDGPLLQLVRRLNLPRVAARRGYHRPSPLTALHLAVVAARGRFDVIHAYEWPPAVEAYLATAFSRRRVAVVTVMSMAVAPFLPSSMSLVVGTERIRQHAAARRSGATSLLEPPVDVEWNAPAGRGADFRAAYRLDGPLVVVVSRLAHELKLEGILTAVRAVGRLAGETPVRLVVVGDGPAAQEVRDLVAERGHGAVLLTGLLEDPRGAYDAADVVIGMGGSALKGMAFAKPLIVQGEHGFFRLLTPESAGDFLEHGWYGVGEGDLAMAEDDLVHLLRELLKDERRREELGSYGRQLLEQRFSLVRAAAVQERVYRQAIAHRAGLARRVLEGVVAAAGLVAHKAGRRLARRRGVVQVDDFNARPA
ncbi:glycosyltransferase [Ornithinimicrobium kibberense]